MNFYSAFTHIKNFDIWNKGLLKNCIRPKWINCVKFKIQFLYNQKKVLNVLKMILYSEVILTDKFWHVNIIFCIFLHIRIFGYTWYWNNMRLCPSYKLDVLNYYYLSQNYSANFDLTNSCRFSRFTQQIFCIADIFCVFSWLLFVIKQKWARCTQFI